MEMETAADKTILASFSFPPVRIQRMGCKAEENVANNKWGSLCNSIPEPTAGWVKTVDGFTDFCNWKKSVTQMGPFA